MDSDDEALHRTASKFKQAKNDLGHEREVSLPLHHIAIASHSRQSSGDTPALCSQAPHAYLGRYTDLNSLDVVNASHLNHFEIIARPVTVCDEHDNRIAVVEVVIMARFARPIFTYAHH